MNVLKKFLILATVAFAMQLGAPDAAFAFGPGDAKRAAEGATGGRAKAVGRRGKNYVVRVVVGGSVKSCIVNGRNGRVRCR